MTEEGLEDARSGHRCPCRASPARGWAWPTEHTGRNTGSKAQGICGLEATVRPQSPSVLPSTLLWALGCLVHSACSQQTRLPQTPELPRYSCAWSHHRLGTLRVPTGTSAASPPFPTEPWPTKPPGLSIPYHATYLSRNTLEICCHVVGGTLLHLSAPTGPLLMTAGSPASQPNLYGTFTSATRT